MQDKRWEVLYKPKTQNSKFNSEEIVNILLTNRGVKTEKQKIEFFNPKDPLEISLKELGIDGKAVGLAINRIRQAREKEENVLVYGDYDADGICATAILWEILYELGVKALPYIPERFSEGYGLNIESIKNLKKRDPNLSLIITVDHGIVAEKKVDLARDLGIDLIITDHHQPGEKKPKPLSLIHTTKIGGAAVSWVLARELVRNLNPGKLTVVEQSLELVALGTIADQIPLIGPNRSFVRHGLTKLRSTKRLGFLALFELAGINSQEINPYHIGFVIAPRLNAMGRLEHAMESLRLLCTKDKVRAQKLALHLNKVNLERQGVVEKVVEHAKKILGKDVASKVIVIAHKSYHEGVIGLAASRLVEEYYKPTIVISKSGEISKASARSIAGFNIIETIRKIEEYLLEGGGHPMAAGFSINTKNIKLFAKKFEKLSLNLLTEDILKRTLRIDMELFFDQINEGLHSTLEEFEPIGLNNPTPTFISRGVEVVSTRIIGKDGAHLKLSLKQNEKTIDAVGFGMAAFYDSLKKSNIIDVVYTIDENVWNGSRSLQLKVKDLRAGLNN